MNFLKVIIIIGIIAGIAYYFGFYQSLISTPRSFKDRLFEINEQFNSTKTKFDNGLLDEKSYKKSTEDLLEKQEKLYSDVKNHIWNESQITEYNSLIKGIMKFPSDVEQEYQKHFR